MCLGWSHASLMHAGLFFLALLGSIWSCCSSPTEVKFGPAFNVRISKGDSLSKKGPIRSGALYPEHQKPIFIQDLEDQSFEVGDSIRLEVRLSSPISDPKLVVRWYHNGRLLDHGSRHQMGFEFSIAFLKIDPSVILDSGNYIFAASNRAGQAQTTCSIIVEDYTNEPKDRTEPADLLQYKKGKKLWQNGAHVRSHHNDRRVGPKIRSFPFSVSDANFENSDASNGNYIRIKADRKELKDDYIYQKLRKIIPASDPVPLESYFGGSQDEKPFALPESTDSEVTPGLFQGDIAGFTPELYIRIGINWHVHPDKKWPDGIVPYYISPKYLPQERIVLERAIAAINFFTCLKFVAYDRRAKDYILIWPIEKPKGCWSYVGRKGGQQVLSIQRPAGVSKGCVGSMGKPMHELLHALGIFHEQSRPDRDQFVTINFNNIAPKYEKNFRLKDKDEVSYEFPYDYDSVMHYGRKFFSKDGKRPTIVPTKKGVKIGQRQMLSRLDCFKLNSLYGCLERDPFEAAKYIAYCDILTL